MYFNRLRFEYSLEIDDVINEHDYLDDRKDDHGQGWRTELHAPLVGTVCGMKSEIVELVCIYGIGIGWVEMRCNVVG